MPDRKTIDVYDAHLEDYLKAAHYKEQAAARSRFIERIGVGGYVLDFGSGPGVDSKAMQDAGLIVRALDASETFVTAAKAQGIDAVLGSFDDLVEEDTYDGVWASFSLLHAPRSEFARHIRAIKRALKPDGALFLGLKLGHGEARDTLGRFYTYFTESEIIETLEMQGFKGLDVTRGKGAGLSGQSSQFILVTADA